MTASLCIAPFSKLQFLSGYRLDDYTYTHAKCVKLGENLLHKVIHCTQEKLEFEIRLILYIHDVMKNANQCNLCKRRLIFNFYAQNRLSLRRKKKNVQPTCVNYYRPGQIYKCLKNAF